MSYSEEELAVIRTVFDSCDGDRIGRIHINQLSGMLMKLGKTDDDVVRITEMSSKFADESEGLLSYEEILQVLNQTAKSYELPFEGSDPKVLEFLQILEEYRVKCEEEGNYLEAARAHRQLGVLRRQEEKRQQKAIQARQISEKQDVQFAHNMQFNEFNRSWDKYLEEYDSMAQIYIEQMTERHAVVLLEFQKQLRTDIASKPPKWSKELLDQRRKQHINARNKNYSQAQKLKKLSDKTEEKERREMEQAQAVIFARREAKFRMQQQTELQALLKRIECRRKEHIKQRNLDTKRLLQRNRNVQAVLDSKQASECQKLFSEIKKTLYSSAALHGGAATSVHSNTLKKSTATSTEGGGTKPRKGVAYRPGEQSAQLQSQYDEQYRAQQGDFYPQSYPEGGQELADVQYDQYRGYEAKQREGSPYDAYGNGGGREAKDGYEYEKYDQKYDPLEEAIDQGLPDYDHAYAPSAPMDPFMDQEGPSFSNLVYGGPDFLEDESQSLEGGPVY
ncbi:hypothetical protein B484DRAFT_191771 [Ochromonadaceae sp. CCMP2298]|nr:hypothetical protein B484DRAFT_191771 [Ochromonadaceae sp. CCMP2298]|mmetsp:Transcript_31097/g.68561  ORF Transcript_31097/g.68561 Transcript_31097/m.68561 type:complete len:505 (-) Transcript_31097:305-1819(-)|eukprot:CAMPEP_0173191128 /NCGR_PEP_ID=MMETSP1141-20130122/12719_1 /TAXON_ID=483371 /ORGANISM="non described non described, Strain CCMP2298" /LENGTH=504 /DNA_ID=CAMNT_0014115295 /DNA_START=115 /DNA_END=1629 /DNA_ORIENTATION=+